MAIIYSYPQFAPKPEDLLIGTVVLDENAAVPIYDNPTVSFTIQSIVDLIAPVAGLQNLQSVTTVGATTNRSVTFSNDIKVTGRIYDSSGGAGTAGQVLSSTVTGTSWIVNSPASVTSVGLSMPAAFSVANSPITTAGTLAVTGAGSALQYINGLGNLVTFPTIPTQYVLPLAANGTRGGIQIGYSSAGKNYAVQLSSEKAFVNVPWTDTPYTLPVATSSDLGGVKIGYTDNAKNYAVELDSDQMYVNVPWTDTPYVLPLAADGTRGGVQIGYTQAATRDYPVTLDSEKMLVTVPWTDTQNPNQTLLGTGSDNSDSGIILNESGGTVLILGDGSVTAAQTSNTITLTGVNTWVANAVTVAGYVAAPAATDVNLVWKTNGSGEPAWRADADTDTGITGVTLAINSTGTWTVPLSESITGRELTLTSNVYGGGAKVGYVPTGGTSSLYLKGDGSWAAVPTGLQFQGTWDARNIAEGGASDGGDPDLDGIAGAADGWLYIVSVAGSAVPNGAATTPNSWNIGDWCVFDGTNWTRVPSSTAGVTTLTTTDGTYIDLTPASPTTATGPVTVTADLSAQDGSSDTSTKFLSKDNTWDVPSYTTNTDETYDLNAGAKVSTSVPINLTSTSGTDNSLVNLKEGTNITLTRGSATEITIDATNTNTNTTYDFLAIETIPTFTIVSGGGSGYTPISSTVVNVATTGGSGTGLTVDITIDATGSIVLPSTVNNPGSGYAIGEVLTITGGTATITLAGSVGNVNPNLRLIDNAFAFEDVKLTGAGATTITRTSNTGITISSTDTNTQYTAGNGLNLSGTVFSADVNNTQANSATTALSATAGRFYAVQLDNNAAVASANLVVNVPWTDNNTEYLAMTTSTLGLGKIRYDVGSTPAAESQSTTASRTYGITKNASNQLVVNVPWVSGGSYNWKVRDNAGTPVNKTLSSGEFLQFKTATGALATGLAGSGTTGSPYVMTLTSPNTTYSTVSTSAAGLAPTLPAAVGGKFLKADATWDVPDYVTYSDFTVSTASAPGTAGLVPAPAAGTQGGTYYLNGDKSFSVPPNTEYDVMGSGNSYAAGLVLAGSATNGGAFLRKDGTWQVPPGDGNTTYSIDVPASTTNINLKGANPSSNDAVAMTPGSGISVTRNSSSQLTFANTAQDTGLPAIIVDDAAGNMSFGNGNVTAATVRTKIGAGTGDGTVGGTGVNNRIALWNGTVNIDSDADFYVGSSTLFSTNFEASGTVTAVTGTFSGNITALDATFTNEVTVNKTNATTPGKITIKGNSGPILQLKSEDTAMADDELIGAIEFYNSDGTANAGVRAKIESRTLVLGGTGNEGNLGFFTATASNVAAVRRLKITPSGGFSFGNTSTAYGGSGQVLTSAGDAPPTWETPSTGDNFYLDGITKGTGVDINKLTFEVLGATDQSYTFGANAFNSSTIYAEPGIFSGGGTPTLATNVTPLEVRTLIGAGTGDGDVTASSTTTFTNKSGNISMWTNNSGYITSESDTLLSVTQRGASTSVATNFTGSLTVNGSGAGAYFYVSGNAQGTAPPTTYNTGLAMAWNNSGGSRENEIYFATGSGATQAENDSTYFSFINRFNTAGTPVDTRVAKFYGNGDVDFLGKVFTNADVLAGSTKIIDFATSSVAGDATGFIGNYFTTHGAFANPTTTAATFYDQSGVGPTLSGYRVAIRNYDGTNMLASATFTDTSLTVVGDVIAYGSPSDIRLKENIKPIESALDKVSKLQGVTFDWKKSDSILDIKKDIGFIAQDVQEVIPELVRENKDGMLSMRHQGIAPILLEAIKELKAEIEELKLNKCNCNCNK